MKKKAAKKVSKKKVKVTASKKKASKSKVKPKKKIGKRASPKKALGNFKAKFQKIFGKVNWKSIGRIAFGALVMAASMGMFGPELVIVAEAAAPFTGTV